MKNKFALILLFVLMPVVSFAQANVSFMLGGVTNNRDNQQSTAWQLEYENRPFEQLGFSVSYLNEGELPGHKRDGIAGQIKLYAIPSTNDFSIALNAGPYLWLDTQMGSIERGAAALVGVDGSYKITDFLRLKASWNRVISSDKRDSDVFLVGLGYNWK